jgi:ribokinase
MKKKILMFGSFVVDLTGRGPHIPVPGETVKSAFFKMGPGGKGYNQGIAAFKAGGDVIIVTKLGKDMFANIALDLMNELKMDTSRIFFTDKYSTGVALIEVDETTGQNAIMVVPSACDHVMDEEVESLRDLIDSSDIVLTQLETNYSAIDKVIDIAHEAGKTIVLNTAPVQPVSEELLRKCTVVTPNEVEAGTLSGIEVVDEASAEKAADYFLKKGVNAVVITMGSKGAFVTDGKKKEIIPAYKVNAIDTTGAGDAYNGGFVTALSENKNIFEAAKFASAVGALAVQKIGTAPAMPTREEIDRFIKEHQ